MDISVNGLPEREGLALRLIAMGMTAKQAAREMNCSPRNVEALTSHAMERLDAKNRVHLVTTAFQRGILKVCAMALLASISAGIVPAPAAHASDDEPITRRMRGRPSSRAARRVRRTVGDINHLPEDQGFIDYFQLSPVIVWDDGLYLVYQ